jgi:glyoxylase-like metal-dependent hydrolase (beta-lactamase superfamily II)
MTSYVSRGGVPACLVAVVLALGGGVWTAALRAQQHPSSTKAGLETIQIRPNIYVIFGAGANVTVHVGEDGMVLVDSGSGEAAPRLLEAVKAISPLPIRVIINTSGDLDHVGGNAVMRQRRHQRRRRVAQS